MALSGLERPSPAASGLSEHTKALIGVASGLRHAFFAGENKDCQHGIEAAENQAMRTGAAMVYAQTILRHEATSSETVTTTTTTPIPTDNDDMSDAGHDDDVAADDSPALNTNPLSSLGPSDSNQPQWPIPIDQDTIAFTCNWVPQLANFMSTGANSAPMVTLLSTT